MLRLNIGRKNASTRMSVSTPLDLMEIEPSSNIFVSVSTQYFLCFLAYIFYLDIFCSIQEILNARGPSSKDSTDGGTLH